MSNINQTQKDFANRGIVSIEMIENGYLFDHEDGHRHVDQRAFYTIEDLIKHVQNHYAKLREDIQVAKLSE